MEKICSNCNHKKPINEFYYIKRIKSHAACCKKCHCKKTNQYKLANKEKINESNKTYRETHREEKRLKDKIWIAKNKDKKKASDKAYRERTKHIRRIKTKERKEKDPLFKFKLNVSKLIVKTFKQNNCKKQNKTTEILGCTMIEFKSYIEKQFQPWMNWNNYGMYDPNFKRWQLDHITPISSAKTEEEVLKLNHYTNFQPLDAMENMLKSNKT
jgi:cytochrome c553